MDALVLIPREDAPQTLFYCDPPYVHETRATTDAYAHEMSTQQHRQLLNVLLRCKGKVMLSGYRSELYDSTLSHWRRVDFDIANHASGSDSKRRMVESLWLNYAPGGNEGT
jgi:DNA adenine methylase